MGGKGFLSFDLGDFQILDSVAYFTALSTVKLSQSYKAPLYNIGNRNDTKSWKFSRDTVVS